MGKAIVYTALVVVCLGAGALIAGLAVHYAEPKTCTLSPQSRTAECQLVPNLNNITGRLEITETSTSNITMVGTITGLNAGLHGFHVHQYGVIGVDCGSTKGHWNPHGKKHGSPDSKERHVGDLGNINVASNSANFELRVSDKLASLFGVDSIVGRAIVIHAGEDDLVTDPTGNAGSRLACCTIMHLPESTRK